MLTFVNIVITELIYYQFVFLFMKAIRQQHKKEIHNVEINQEKQSKSDEARVNEILIRYFAWYINNNIEEFQTFFKFWNQKFTNQSSVFLR